MFPLFTIPTTLKLAGFVTTTGAVGLRLHTPWWRSRIGRGLALASVAALGVGFLAWTAGGPSLAHRGVTLVWTTLLVIGPLSVALFASGLFRRLTTTIAPSLARRHDEPGYRLSRRALLEGTAAALPLASVAASARGIAGADGDAQIRPVRMDFEDLHPDLEGLRILHLTDLHLGAALTSVDLERALARAQKVGFDLLVLTGDVADDLRELEKGLAVALKYKPKHGVFAALGNHEYLHGIQSTRPIYERSGIPLLVDRSETIAVGDAKLHVTGVDDPYGRYGDDRFASLQRLSAGAPEGAFRLLLCHRPSGFPKAAEHGFQLTLAGHTHGGQIGAFGRSVLEPLFPKGFLWGSYAIGERKLYTSSGFGHWFPFRLGCPTETPIIVLTRASISKSRDSKSTRRV